MPLVAFEINANLEALIHLYLVHEQTSFKIPSEKIVFLCICNISTIGDYSKSSFMFWRGVIFKHEVTITRGS